MQRRSRGSATLPKRGPLRGPRCFQRSFLTRKELVASVFARFLREHPVITLSHVPVPISFYPLTCAPARLLGSLPQPGISVPSCYRGTLKILFSSPYWGRYGAQTTSPLSSALLEGSQSAEPLARGGISQRCATAILV